MPEWCNRNQLAGSALVFSVECDLKASEVNECNEL